MNKVLYEFSTLNEERKVNYFLVHFQGSLIMLDHLHVIAHRGASAYAPENTLAAFQRAEVLGAGCIEFDVQLNAEGELFVFHDERLTRTTNGQGPFAAAGRQRR